MNQPKLKANPLHIAHQSELIVLKKQVAALQFKVAQLDSLLAADQSVINAQKKIKLPTDRGLEFVNIDEIIYCKAMGNYTQIFTVDTKYLISKTLKCVVELISHSNFIRCHQSYLINIKNIKSFSSKNGLTAYLINDISIPISRRKKQEVIAAISHE